MSQSHHSLKTLYECSHENLEKLIAISKDFGVGARLTGAGWGGCIVALADSITTCDKYITTLKKCYYDKIPHAKNLDLDSVVFATVRKFYLLLVMKKLTLIFLSQLGASKRCGNLHCGILLD
jgi:N-acetylgalactosamine kinase